MQIDKVRDIEPGVRCIVAGTIFKKMKLKPDVISEISKERAISLKRSLSATPYGSGDDTLLLEVRYTPYIPRSWRRRLGRPF